MVLSPCLNECRFHVATCDENPTSLRPVEGSNLGKMTSDQAGMRGTFSVSCATVYECKQTSKDSLLRH